MKWLREYTLTLGLGLALAALGINAVVAYGNIEWLTASNRRVAETHARIDAADDVLATLVDAETGHRGFIITELEPFLEPHQRALVAIPDRFARLRELFPGDADRARADELERLATAKIVEMHGTIEMVQAGERPAAVARMQKGYGKEIMDKIRALVRSIRDDETADLHKLRDVSRANLIWSKWSNLLSAALGVGLVVVAATLFFRDLAARDRAKTALQNANEQLEQVVAERTVELRRSNRALEEFAAVASHDLQEPLRKIQQFGDRLDKKLGPALDEANRDFLRRMLDAATRMRTLIGDLLTYSRVSTKAQPPVRVDLNDVVRGVVGDLDGRLQQCGGRVEFADLPAVAAEPTQMRQLFQNLLGNALKFQKPDVPPVVRVSATTRDADGQALVELVFADNGIGFDAKYAEKIFHLFQRLHGRDEYEGTGMGLAIVRKIVEQHGGAVVARSRPGDGATFVVTLPAAP